MQTLEKAIDRMRGVIEGRVVAKSA